MTSPNEGQATSLERFQTLVDSYGANLARIPASERAGVQSLLAQSDEAKRIWNDAKELDDLLGEAPASAAPSPALRKRLENIPAREAQDGNVVQFPRRARTWAAVAAAAALLLGVIAGAQEHEDDLAPVATLALNDPGPDDSELSEFGALAFGGELVTDLEVFEGDAE
jgi:hypothetical protein